MLGQSAHQSEFDAAILDRVIDPGHSTLSPDAARSIMALGFPQLDIERMNLLSEKARNGLLAPEEDAELDSYLRVGRFLALMQAKARQSLQRFAGVPA